MFNQSKKDVVGKENKLLERVCEYLEDINCNFIAFEWAETVAHLNPSKFYTQKKQIATLFET